MYTCTECTQCTAEAGAAPGAGHWSPLISVQLWPGPGVSAARALARVTPSLGARRGERDGQPAGGGDWEQRRGQSGLTRAQSRISHNSITRTSDDEDTRHVLSLNSQDRTLLPDEGRIRLK